MEAEAGEYRRLDIKQYAPRSIRETAENKFWKKFKAPVVAKQVSQMGPGAKHADTHHFSERATISDLLFVQSKQPQCLLLALLRLKLLFATRSLDQLAT
jgi:hypothetical protein